MKDWWKSKQFWVGALQLIASVSMYVYEFLVNNNGTVTAAELTLFINGLAMVILRFVTDRPISAPGILNWMRPKITHNERARRYIAR